MEPHETSSRRGFLQTGIAVPVAAGLASGPGSAAAPTANVYARLGVKPFISAVGTLTTLSGTLMPPEVVQAMEAASRQFVRIHELQKVGRKLADLTGAEAAFVTAGASAALWLASCAVTGIKDPARMHQLPDITGMKSELIIQKAHRNSYDHSFHMVGLKLVAVQTAAEIRAAITSRTAALAMVLSHNSLGHKVELEEMISIAHGAGLPLILDAAAEGPPPENLSKFVKMGADPVAFSGGKNLRGPQCSGMLMGRKDLIEAAYANSSPNNHFARNAEVGKEEIVGPLTAVELCLAKDHAAERREWTAMLDRIADRLRTLPTLRTEFIPNLDYSHSPRLSIQWDEAKLGITLDEMVTRLRSGEPSIEASDMTRFRPVWKGLGIFPYNLKPGEEIIIADRGRQILTPKAWQPKRSQKKERAMKVTIYVLIILAASLTHAQTLDTGILGTVTDPTGAVVAGASVTITLPATGQSRSVTTGGDGTYDVRYLVPGDYSVEIKAAGFRTARRSGIQLQIGQQARVDFPMQVGEMVETVEVIGQSPILQTETAVLGAVVGAEHIKNLPLNGRNFLQLAALTAGVTVAVESNAQRTRVIANGARDIWMQVNVNGITAVNNRHNFVNFYPSIDAIQEFKVQTGNYTAEYGGNAGANINVELRPGANRLHGSFFEFLRNDHLDARGYFRPQPLPKDVLRQNQFGTVVSGRIIKDRTFFMVGYEAQRAAIERAGTAVVATPQMKRGDFSAVTGAITDPLSGSPFPGNVIPASRLNPVSVNLINQYMPLANVEGAVNYAGVTKDITNVDQGLARIDHSLTAKDQLAFHFLYAAKDLPNWELNPNFFYNATFPNTNLGIQHVHTFSPTLLNEVRFGLMKGHIQKLSPRTGGDFRIESLGINGLKVGGPDGRTLRADEQGFPVLNIEGYLGLGDSQASSNLDDSRSYQFVENFSFFRHGHSFKMGGDIRYLLDDATTNNWPFGNLAFTRDVANLGIAAYMLGYPRTILTPEGVPISSPREWRYALYFQDDWKVSQKLTLNLGIRYDLVGQPHEVNNISRTLRWDLDPKGPVLWPEPGKSADLWVNEYRYFGPRLGLAYRLGNKSVIRSGYGIFYTAAHFDNINILQLNPPSAGSLTITNPASNPPATIENPVPRALFPQNPIFNVVTLPPDRKRRNANIQNWNFIVSRQLSNSDVLEAGWVGSKGTHVDSSLNNYNNPAPSLVPFDQSRRPYPQFNRIRMIVADGNTIFHSLQSKYEHRFSHGLSVTAHYTWSHLIDDSNQTVNRGACGCQDPNNRRAERADSIFDIRHRLVAGYVWEIPWAKSMKGVAGAVIGGWQVGNIITLRSGSPFNVIQSGDSQNVEFSSWERPNVVPGVSPRISNRDAQLWFNTNAFSRSNGAFGTAPRDAVVGPGIHTFDVAAAKSFKMPFAESHALQFRTEFFNTLNTPQLGNPGGTLGTGTFGRVTSTQQDNRQIQFALKYTF